MGRRTLAAMNVAVAIGVLLLGLTLATESEEGTMVPFKEAIDEEQKVETVAPSVASNLDSTKDAEQTAEPTVQPDLQPKNDADPSVSSLGDSTAVVPTGDDGQVVLPTDIPIEGAKDVDDLMNILEPVMEMDDKCGCLTGVIFAGEKEEEERAADSVVKCFRPDEADILFICSIEARLLEGLDIPEGGTIQLAVTKTTSAEVFERFNFGDDAIVFGLTQIVEALSLGADPVVVDQDAVDVMEEAGEDSKLVVGYKLDREEEDGLDLDTTSSVFGVACIEPEFRQDLVLVCAINPLLLRQLGVKSDAGNYRLVIASKSAKSDDLLEEFGPNAVLFGVTEVTEAIVDELESGGKDVVKKRVPRQSHQGYDTSNGVIDDGTDEFCRGKENKAFSQGCSHTFTWCWDGVASTHSCPDNMFFDEERGACDMDMNVFECSGRRFVTQETEPEIVDFECQSDGLFAGYSDQCVTDFIHCSNKIAFRKQCADGLAFDPDSKVCARPEHINVCGGNPDELNPPEVDFNCPGDNGLFPHPSVLCSRVHFECTNGVPERKFCLTSELFDENSRTCRPTDQVPDCDFDCSQRETGVYSVGCSRDFWWCWDFRPTKVRCPAGFYFNSENGQCDRFSQVYECTGEHIAPTEAAVAPTEFAGFDCFGFEDGDYPLPTASRGSSGGHYSCLVDFVKCANGVAFKFDCPAGLHFDPIDRICNPLANIVACGGSPPTEQTTERSNFECPEANGYFAHPTLLCSATHFECIDNEAKTKICKKGEVFDETISTCRLMSEVEQCDFDCSSRDNGPYSEGCSNNYWWCWDGVGTKLACPLENMFFDEERGICDVEPTVFECTGRRFTPTRLDQGPLAETVDFDCSAGEGDHALTRSECTADFVKCANNIPYKFSCPGSLRFDPVELQCNNPADIDACRRSDAPAGGYGSRTAAPAPAPTRGSRRSYERRRVTVPTPTRATRRGGYRISATVAPAPRRRGYGFQQSYRPAVETVEQTEEVVSGYGGQQRRTARPLQRSGYGQRRVETPTRLRGYGQSVEPSEAAPSGYGQRPTVAPRRRSGYGQPAPTEPPRAPRRYEPEPEVTVAAPSGYGQRATPAPRRQGYGQRVVTPSRRRGYGGQRITAAPRRQGYGQPAPTSPPTEETAPRGYGVEEEPTISAPSGYGQEDRRTPSPRRRVGYSQRVVPTQAPRRSGYALRTRAIVAAPSGYGQDRTPTAPRRVSGYGQRPTTPAAPSRRRSYSRVRPTPAAVPSSGYGQQRVTAAPSVIQRRRGYRPVQTRVRSGYAVRQSTPAPTEAAPSGYGQSRIRPTAAVSRRSGYGERAAVRIGFGSRRVFVASTEQTPIQGGYEATVAVPRRNGYAVRPAAPTSHPLTIPVRRQGRTGYAATVPPPAARRFSGYGARP